MRALPLLVLALVAVPAIAQDAGRPAAPAPGNGKVPEIGPVPPSLVVEPAAMMIAACDADGDARVTRDELKRCVAHSFATIDTAKAGTIGYIAFADWAEKWLGDRTALPSPFDTDTDGDNRISLAELQAKFDQIFTRLDKDKDGVLTRAELLTVRANIAPDFGSRKKGGR